MTKPPPVSFKDNLDGCLHFYSVSGDGRVTLWTLVEASLWWNDDLLLKYEKPLDQTDDMNDHIQNGGRCFAFKPDEDNLFLIGTDTGEVCKP